MRLSRRIRVRLPRWTAGIGVHPCTRPATRLQTWAFEQCSNAATSVIVRRSKSPNAGCSSAQLVSMGTVSSLDTIKDYILHRVLSSPLKPELNTPALVDKVKHKFVLLNSKSADVELDAETEAETKRSR